MDWILILFFTVDKTCTVSLMSANANDFTDSKGSGGEREEKRLPGTPLSFFHIVFEVLITGVKGQSSSEQHFTFLNMLQKVCV